jgi:hypothetical protein
MCRTHTMLGPNPKKAATPSTNASNFSSSSDQNVAHGDGLMVKAINDIFKFVESSENPQEFRVRIVLFIVQSFCIPGPYHIELCKFSTKWQFS